MCFFPILGARARVEIHCPTEPRHRCCSGNREQPHPPRPNRLLGGPQDFTNASGPRPLALPGHLHVWVWCLLGRRTWRSMAVSSSPEVPLGLGASLHSLASTFLPAQCSLGCSPQNRVHSSHLPPGLCPGSIFLPSAQGSKAGSTGQGLNLIGPS